MDFPRPFTMSNPCMLFSNNGRGAARIIVETLESALLDFTAVNKASETHPIPQTDLVNEVPYVDGRAMDDVTNYRPETSLSLIDTPEARSRTLRSTYSTTAQRLFVRCCVYSIDEKNILAVPCSYDSCKGRWRRSPSEV